MEYSCFSAFLRLISLFFQQSFQIFLTKRVLLQAWSSVLFNETLVAHWLKHLVGLVCIEGRENDWTQFHLPELWAENSQNGRRPFLRTPATILIFAEIKGFIVKKKKNIAKIIYSKSTFSKKFFKNIFFKLNYLKIYRSSHLFCIKDLNYV